MKGLGLLSGHHRLVEMFISLNPHNRMYLHRRISNTRNLIVWMTFAILLGLSACQSDKIDNTLIVEPPEEGVSFSEDILPLFIRSCGGGGCHIDASTSGVNIASFQQVMASVGNQYAGDIVIPGDADGSPLVDKIGAQPEIGLRMPLGGTPLSNEEIALIEVWIDEGAENN